MRKFLLGLAMSAMILLPTAASAGDSVNATLEYNQLYDGKVNYTRTFDEGTTVGATVESTVGSHKELTGTLVEAELGQNVDLWIFKGYAKAGVGEQFNQFHNFPLWDVTAGLDTRLSDYWTWNTIKYRHRASFDAADNVQGDRLQTGITYNIDTSDAVTVGAFHDFHQWDFSKEDFKDGNGVSVGFTRSF
jgi:hypothetical protein